MKNVSKLLFSTNYIKIFIGSLSQPGPSISSHVMLGTELQLLSLTLPYMETDWRSEGISPPQQRCLTPKYISDDNSNLIFGPSIRHSEIIMNNSQYCKKQNLYRERLKPEQNRQRWFGKQSRRGFLLSVRVKA